MVWAATAIIGSAVVGAGVGIYSAKKSSSAAARASDQQSVANARQAKSVDLQLQFQQQQYADWQAVYGPIQDNLSNFYQNLTPDALVASGLKNYEIQHQNVLQNLERSFSQRGIESPAQALLLQEDALRAAEAKATLRTDAPFKVAQGQQGFLDHNVQNPAAGGVTNAYGSQAQLFAGQRAFYGSQVAQANNLALTGYQAAGQAIQGGVSGYLQYQQYQSLQGQQTAPPAFAPPLQPAAPYYAVT